MQVPALTRPKELGAGGLRVGLFSSCAGDPAPPSKLSLPCWRVFTGQAAPENEPRAREHTGAPLPSPLTPRGALGKHGQEWGGNRP